MIVAGAGGLLLARAVAGGGVFQSTVVPAPRLGGTLASRTVGGLFPVTGPRWLFGVWDAAELRWSVAAVVLLPAAGLDASALPSQVVGIVLVAALMGFCVTRLTANGPSAALMRLRHHVEMGCSPHRLTAGLAGVTYAASAPVLATISLLLLTGAGAPLPVALGVVVLAPIATLTTDALVAQPGADGLTESRLLILALLQSLLVIGGWFLFTIHPAAGWPLPLILAGVFTWLYPRRLTRWLPRSRP
ncbi:hypothetical protein [Micropruina sp.]|uniref:hypothetical protein n=1 Tax=Micropruina sp. TaxID=2737536 RepID=UPI0039E5DB3B